MAYSSIYGADVAPAQPSGRDAELLGPSDSSDTGSDALGTHEVHGDSDASGTGERASAGLEELREGADILPDRVIQLTEGGEMAEGEETADGAVFAEASADGQEFTDLDADEPDDEEEAR